MNPINPDATNPGPIYEGAFAYTPPYYYEPGGGPPYPSILAGPTGLAAGTMTGQSGIAAGRFGWADLGTYIVNNARTNAAQQIGIVIPRRANWQSCYFSSGVRYIRTGYPVTVHCAGAFWLVFKYGAFAGDPVYADVDGTALSNSENGGELTKFFVTQGCTPGGLGQVSTWAKFV